MLNLTEEQIKELIINKGFRKTLNTEELVKILAQLIEFSQFLKDNLPNKNTLVESKKIRVFAHQTLNEDKFEHFAKTQKRVFLDSRDSSVGSAIANRLLAEDPNLRLNITLVNYNDLPPDRQ